jgi:hypothetical protein
MVSDKKKELSIKIGFHHVYLPYMLMTTTS